MKRATDEPAQVGTVFGLLLCVAAGCAHLATFAAIAELSAGGAALGRGLPAAVGIMLLSFPSRWFARRTRRGEHGVLWLLAAAIAVGLQVSLVALLAEHGTGVAFLAALLAIQGAVLARASDVPPAVLSLALSVVQSLLALGVAPGALTLGATLLVVGTVPAAATVLHAGQARLRVAVSRRSFEPTPAGKGELGRRLRFALRLSLPGIGLAIVVMAVLSSAGRPSRAGLDSMLGFDPAEDEDGRGARLDGTGAGSDSFDAGIGFGGADGRTSNDPVAWVRLREHESGRVVRDGRALWLRALLLDTFTEGGLRQLDLADVRVVDDGDDGARDGWIELSDLGTEPLLELQFHQRPLRAAGASGDVVLQGLPALAVELPRVRHHADRATTTGALHSEWFAYRVLATAAGLRALRRADLDESVRSAHADPRFVQLPPPSPALERVEREARAAVRGAASDRERVDRVLAHFRDGFSYSLEGTGFVGLESVAAFLDRREGYCTAYATAAVLMLRSLGLPARSAVGYLVTEWDPDEAAYMIRGRHAHAWVEVHFVRRGWVAFDPTPPDQRNRALARAIERDARPTGLARWGADLAGAVQGLALGGREPADALEAFAAGPEALLASARRSPLLAALVASAFVTLAALRYFRPRLRRGPLGIPLPLRTRAESFWERVVLALEDRGFHRRPSETPREFARAVVFAGGVGYAPVLDVVELLYRSRWGGRAPGRDERARVAAFLRDLRN